MQQIHLVMCYLKWGKQQVVQELCGG